MAHSFRLHGRLVDPEVNRVTFGGETTQVEPKIMQVLVALADHAGRVVTRDDLMARVWSGVFVTDDALNRAIRELRRLFDDDADTPRVIETIRKRGYRLIAAVEPIPDERASHVVVDPPAPATGRGWIPGPVSMGAMLVAALVLGAAMVWFGMGRRPVPVEARVRFVPLTADTGNETAPALSPSGRLAYVARGSDGRAHLFATPRPDMAAVQITSGADRETAPAWSPDDRHIAFARLTSGGCDIWIADTDARDERRIAPCGTRDAQQMSWSPDGAELAITSGAGRPGAPSHIDLLTIATGATRALTVPPPGHVGDDSPAFSPDGREIAFVTPHRRVDRRRLRRAPRRRRTAARHGRQRGRARTRLGPRRRAHRLLVGPCRRDQRVARCRRRRRAGMPRRRRREAEASIRRAAHGRNRVRRLALRDQYRRPADSGADRAGAAERHDQRHERSMEFRSADLAGRIARRLPVDAVGPVRAVGGRAQRRECPSAHERRRVPDRCRAGRPTGGDWRTPLARGQAPS